MPTAIDVFEKVRGHERAEQLRAAREADLLPYFRRLESPAAPVVEMDVGAADLGHQGLEHGAARSGTGRGQTADLERGPGRRHDRGADGLQHGGRF